MRAKNLNTMYRRRSVRPDARVYRQIRKLSGGSPSRYRPRGAGGIVLAAVGVIVVVSVAVWLLRR